MLVLCAIMRGASRKVSCCYISPEMKMRGGERPSPSGSFPIAPMPNHGVDDDTVKVLCLKWLNNFIFAVALVVLIATTSVQTIKVLSCLQALCR